MKGERELVETEQALEEHLLRPQEANVDALADLNGALILLGLGGKIGPSLARLAKRAAKETDVDRPGPIGDVG